MPHPEGFLLRAYKNIPKKARTGIYHGKQVNVGTRISREYEVRSRRLVKPNVHRVYLYSQALGQKIKLPVTTAALRAIDNAGGLDRYLLKTPDSLLHSDVASNLKFKLTTIYRHKQYEEQQQQKLRQQQQQEQQPPQLTSGSQPRQLAAAQAAQRAALAAGGTSLPGLHSFSSWSSSNRPSCLLPPAAAAAAAAAAAVSEAAAASEATAAAAAARVPHS